MAKAKTSKLKADIDFESELWNAANELRGAIAENQYIIIPGVIVKLSLPGVTVKLSLPGVIVRLSLSKSMFPAFAKRLHLKK